MTEIDYKEMAEKSFRALFLLNLHYDDLAKSNPGFLRKLCLQDYALLNDAFLEVEAVFRKYPEMYKQLKESIEYEKSKNC
jgi:hypothetical protein